MEDKDTYHFMSVCQDFVKSSMNLRESLELCGDDPVKKDMVSFAKEDFEKLWSKTEGISLMVEKGFTENREFIIEEIKEATKNNNDLAQKIKEKLLCLN
jgi:hypothetical protein